MELGLLILRLAIGGTVAAHGAQKLLAPNGGGHGIDDTTGVLGGLGFRPARAHAWLLALAELAGGLFLAAGVLTPLAAAAVIGVMIAAIGAVHLPHGFFAQAGGIEFPLVLVLGATAVALIGPGDWSIDHGLGWTLSGYGWSVAAIAFGLAAGLGVLAARHVTLPGLGRGRHAAHA